MSRFDLPFVESAFDPRFGHIDKLNAHHSPSFIAVKRTQHPSQESFALSLEEFELRKCESPPFLLQVLEWRAHEDKLVTEIAFPFSEPFNLEENMTSNEKIIAFRCVLEAMSNLQKLNLVHGDIRSEYFSIDRDSKRVTLVDRLIENSSPLQTQQRNIKRGRNLYVPGKVFEQLMNKRVCIKHNAFKTDSFCLGLCFLESFCSAELVQKLYIKAEKKFDEKGLGLVIETVLGENKEETVKSFILFLKNYLLRTEEENALTPIEALEKLKGIEELKPVWNLVDFFNAEVDKKKTPVENFESKKVFSLPYEEETPNKMSKTHIQRVNYVNNEERIAQSVLLLNTHPSTNEKHIETNSITENSAAKFATIKSITPSPLSIQPDELKENQLAKKIENLKDIKINQDSVILSNLQEKEENRSVSVTSHRKFSEFLKREASLNKIENVNPNKNESLKLVSKKKMSESKIDTDYKSLAEQSFKFSEQNLPLSKKLFKDELNLKTLPKKKAFLVENTLKFQKSSIIELEKSDKTLFSANSTKQNEISEQISVFVQKKNSLIQQNQNLDSQAKKRIVTRIKADEFKIELPIEFQTPKQIEPESETENFNFIDQNLESQMSFCEFIEDIGINFEKKKERESIQTTPKIETVTNIHPEKQEINPLLFQTDFKKSVESHFQTPIFEKTSPITPQKPESLKTLNLKIGEAIQSKPVFSSEKVLVDTARKESRPSAVFQDFDFKNRPIKLSVSKENKASQRSVSQNPIQSQIPPDSFKKVNKIENLPQISTKFIPAVFPSYVFPQQPQNNIFITQNNAFSFAKPTTKIQNIPSNNMYFEHGKNLMGFMGYYSPPVGVHYANTVDALGIDPVHFRGNHVRTML